MHVKVYIIACWINGGLRRADTKWPLAPSPVPSSECVNSHLWSIGVRIRSRQSLFISKCSPLQWVPLLFISRYHGNCMILLWDICYIYHTVPESQVKHLGIDHLSSLSFAGLLACCCPHTPEDRRYTHISGSACFRHNAVTDNDNKPQVL